MNKKFVNLSKFPRKIKGQCSKKKECRLENVNKCSINGLNQ